MENDSERNLYLTPIFFRWIILANVVLLRAVGAKDVPYSVIIIVFFYNLILSFFLKPIRASFKRRPSLLSLDFLFCGLILYLTGGWASPFYLYSFAPLLVAALLFKYRGAVFAASAFSLIYSLVLFLNGYNMAAIAKMGRLDSLISNYLSFFLIAIFFAHPASLIDKLETSRAEISRMKEELERVNLSLSISVELGPLSERELEIFMLVAKGKSNREISSELFLSEMTVKNHLSNIFKKLKIKSRDEAANYFLDESSQIES